MARRVPSAVSPKPRVGGLCYGLQESELRLWSVGKPGAGGVGRWPPRAAVTGGFLRRAQVLRSGGFGYSGWRCWCCSRFSCPTGWEQECVPLPSRPR